MDHTQVAPADRVALQRTWLDYKMSHSVDWNVCRSTHMMFVQDATALVQWRHTENGPHVLNVVKVDQASLSLRAGLMVGLVDNEGRHYTVTSDPKEVLPGVFLWTPAFCEVRFVPRIFDHAASPRHLSLALCAKMRSRFDRPVEGHRYIATMKEFCDIFPDIF